MTEEQFKAWRKAWVSSLDLSSSVVAVRPLIMGILNVTPDSFSDGGTFFSDTKAYDRALYMLEAGADIIDIGGVSSRPGAKPVAMEEELARIMPVIERIRAALDVCISVDTSEPFIMQQAVGAGASMINDIYALQTEGALAMARQLDVPVCMMHMQGEPSSMQVHPKYEQGVVPEINQFFSERINACMQAGIALEQLILDPGFGFGKSVQHNLLLVQGLDALHCHGLPLLLGVSRKSTIGAVLNTEVSDRLAGGLALSVIAAQKGVAMLRTHDVLETKHALEMFAAVALAHE